MRWYPEESLFIIWTGMFFTLLMWMFETNFSGSIDYILSTYFTMLTSMFIIILVVKILFKNYRRRNMFPSTFSTGQSENKTMTWGRRRRKRRRIVKKKPFLPSHVKTQAEKEYHKLVRKFKSKHKRNPSNNERVSIIVKTTHNIDTHKGSRGHMRRQKVRKHLVLKYKLRDKFTMSKPKGN
tara:strand:+ start:121 stop:663 length:543 start_codon:yes stop_codon:yes gene_type:complete